MAGNNDSGWILLYHPYSMIRFNCILPRYMPQVNIWQCLSPYNDLRLKEGRRKVAQLYNDAYQHTHTRICKACHYDRPSICAQPLQLSI